MNTDLPEITKTLFGQGKFKDTGRESSGYAESIDSLVGAPARLAIEKARAGEISLDALKSIFNQIGADPELAPTGYDIASKITDNPYLGTILATAIDFGAQLPGTGFIKPGIIGEIKNIKGMGHIIDASEQFTSRLSPGAAQKLLEKNLGDKRFEPSAAKNVGKKFWHDANDHSFTDEAKGLLDNLSARYGPDHKIEEKLLAAQSGPHHMPYVSPPGADFPLPNYSAKPTGVIGEPRIQGMSKSEADPFAWMDDKYKAGKQLLAKHASLGLPTEINTSSDLLAKKDYLLRMPKDSTVNFHMLSGDPTIDRILFPGNASNKRLEAAATAVEAAGHKVNRVYPQSGHDLMRASERAYGHNVEKQMGSFGDRDQAANYLDDILKKQNDLRQTTPIKPDSYAHGGTVVHGLSSFPAHIPMASQSEVSSLLNPTVPTVPDGFTLDASPSLPHGFELDEDKYGGVGGQLASAGLGAASGLTLGASNVALTKSGLMDESTLKALEETNPMAYGAGEIGSLFLPTGAASLIGKAGKATYTGLKALNVLKGVQDGTMAARVLGGAADVAAHAAGSSIEGAAYAGISNSLNEYALGDPDLNAEKIMGHFGMGALYGGAFGGILKAASIGAPPALQAAKDAISSVKGFALGHGMGEESLVSKGLDAVDSSGKLSDQFANRAKNLDVDQMAGLVRDTTGRLNTIHKNIQTTLKWLNSSLRPTETDALINTADKSKVLTATQDVINEMNGVVKKFEESPALFSETAAAVVQGLRDHLVDNLSSKEPIDRFKLLKEIKQKLQSIGWGAPTEKTSLSKPVIQSLTSYIGDVLKNSDVFGAAGSSYAAHDDILSSMYKFIPPKGRRGDEQAREFKKLFLDTNNNFDQGKVKRLLRQSGPEGQRSRDLLDQWFELQKTLPEHIENTAANVPNDSWSHAQLDDLSSSLEKTHGDVGLAQTQYAEALKNEKGRKLGLKDLLLGTLGVSHPLLGGLAFAGDVASRPIEYINKLAEVERLLGKAQGVIEKSAKAVFTPSLKTLGKAKGAIVRQTTAPDLEEHQKMDDDLRQLNNNPSHLIEKLHDSTGALYNVAPKMAEGLQASLIRANQFLLSKLPSPPNSDPFNEPYKPSNSEIAKFNRYMDVVKHPSLVLDHVKSGTITPSDMEVLNSVYPKYYEQMKTALMNHVTTALAKKEPIPFQLKQSLSMFLGTPIAPSLNPMNIQSNQLAFAQAPQPGQPMGGLKKTGDKLTLGKRTGINHGDMDS